MSMARGLKPAPRIRIEHPRPMVGCGRYPTKACVGDHLEVSATVLCDGHDELAAVVRYRGPSSPRWSEAPLRHTDADQGGDTWSGAFQVTEQGRWRWLVEAWADDFATWREELTRKLAAGQVDVAGELAEGAMLLRRIAERADGPDREALERALVVLGEGRDPAAKRREVALDSALLEAARRHPDRTRSSLLTPTVELEVDRRRAREGAWYELFPRSWGGLAGVEEQLPRLAELGFDVLYLAPIHPIGHTNRKGANDARRAGPEDPGSPWAIGSRDGAHKAVDPSLGTLADFDHLVAAAERHGIEIALDFAIQCSADHPWLTEHPEWFHRRPDGSLKYAENPPKHYHDIYNVNFECEDWSGLWQELKSIIDFWVARGVRIFRVDNPHTKPLAFWEWLIAEVRGAEPDVIFLAEAFTRAAMMRALAKVGFNQSYTYFTWKNSRHELQEYVGELARSEMALYYRPNFFLNTPDILSEYLQQGGPGAFATRLVLGATLSPSYGMYSGFEHFENLPAAPGSEEYRDSEKYELKRRALDGPLLPLVARLNRIRREHAAFGRLENVTFLSTGNDALIAYAKRGGGETLLVVVNLDPRHSVEGVVVIPPELGLAAVFAVADLLTGERFDWHVGGNYVRLAPAAGPGHILLAAPPR